MPVVYSYSVNKGLMKDRNDDAINVVTNKQGHIMSIICDGVSSHDKSAYSSNLIVKELSKYWKKSKFEDYDTLKDELINKIYELNNQIIKKSQELASKMATTLVATIFYEDKILVANVGDSLTYGLTNDNILELISKDDSFSGALLEAGVITEEEAINHPKKHSLIQAIGVNNSVELHITEKNCNDFDYVISCSDGLTTMLTKEDIISIIDREQLEKASETLVAEANKRGGLDNISISIFKILRGTQDDRKNNM